MKKETEVEEKKKLNIFIKILIILAIISIILLIIARYYSTSGLKIKEYQVINELLPKNFHGLKIIHFSDIHYTFTTDKEDLDNIKKEINKLNPDIIVYTGDTFPEYKLNETELNELKNFFNSLDATLGKFAITGNHDYQYNDIEKLINETNFTNLYNDRIDIYYKGNEYISIYGLPSYLEDEPTYDIINTEDTSYKIILMHEPDMMDKLEIYNPNLVLAGHSHGGQVRLPFIDALYTPIGSEKYYEEYYKVNETDLYISSGIGSSILPIRFLNKPSFNLYRLYNH